VNNGRRGGFRIAVTIVILLALPWGSAIHANPQRDQFDSQGWQAIDRSEGLERLFLSAVSDQIESSITGIYGASRPYRQAKVIGVQRLATHPHVLRALVQVQTYEGPHIPLGEDTFEFVLDRDKLRLQRVFRKRSNESSRES
jgi:hypothetical protein